MHLIIGIIKNLTIEGEICDHRMNVINSNLSTYTRAFQPAAHGMYAAHVAFLCGPRGKAKLKRMFHEKKHVYENEEG